MMNEKRSGRPAGFLIGLLATGAGAGAWFIDSPGPGVFVLLVALMGAGTVALAGGIRLDPWSIGFGALGLALVSTAVFRAAVWLVVPSLFVAVCLAAVSISGGSSWAELADGVLAPTLRLPAAPGFLRRALQPSPGEFKLQKSVQLLRGLAIGAVPVIVFGALFSSSDLVFRRLVTRLVPNWNLGLLPARGIIFLLSVVATSGFAVAGRLERPRAVVAIADQTKKLIRWKAAPLEWLTALGLINALFAVFVVIQMTVLFGGKQHVLSTAHLTYAEYARQGFGQLVVAAVLTLAVAALAWVWSERPGRTDEIIFRSLLATLCVLTFVVLASALRRLGLYEQAFGFTRSRISAHGVILWLGTVLVVVLVAVAFGRAPWLPRTLVAVTGLAVLGFSVANPDALTARRNIERYKATGKIDLSYLSRLSADAVPELVRLEPGTKQEVLDSMRRDLAKSEAWSSANLSRIRARSLLPRN